MNSLACTIKDVESDKELSVVTLELTDGTYFKSIVIDSPESSSNLSIGNSIQVLFKETEVSIASKPIDCISLQNKLLGLITVIEEERLVSNIHLETKAGSIKAMISTAAVNQLNLEVGQQVFAFIKFNELMLAY
jgi:molybdopterin-binding protein